jgi:hypothetical protein
MNGWKRIGIILSVLWVVVGGFWTRSMVIDGLGKFATNQLDFCLRYDHSGTDCNAEFHTNWQRDVTNVEINAENAIFTFGPLLLAWVVLFYIIVGLTRWVAAGFRQGS